MGTIVPFLDDDPVFGPQDIETMSKALDDVCKALKLDGHTTAREVVATRIIELARRGERNANRLQERVLAEANGVASAMDIASMCSGSNAVRPPK
jgi:hypothetical protein